MMVFYISILTCHCIFQVLKAERPDVDEKRSDLLKLQGKVKLMTTMRYLNLYTFVMVQHFTT